MLRIKSYFVVITLCVFSAVSWSALQSLGHETSRPEDVNYMQRLTSEREKQFKRKFETAKLSNDLEIFIIEDPRAKKASVSMSVGVGFWNDPPEYRGMAHYLEHMLFLGTQKYPEGKEYNEFIKRNGGFNNAFTTPVLTNYYFEVNQSALSEALDRFAQFFIDPTFEKTKMITERSNIDAEYTKNLLNIYAKFQHVARITSNPHHPNARVFQGNNATLKLDSEDDFIAFDKALRAFYRQHYVASNMKLVLISSLPAGTIKDLITTTFSSIPNGDKQKEPLTTSLMRPQDEGRLIELNHQSEEKMMELSFVLPSWVHALYSSPHALMSQLINRADIGSLALFLKSKNLATAIYAYNQDFSSENSMNILFELTDSGRERWQEVCFHFFQYIALLKKEGLHHAVFKDIQREGELAFLQKTPSNNSKKAYSTADYMHDIKALDIEAMQHLLIRYDDTVFRSYLSLINPYKMQIFLSNNTLSAGAEGVMTDPFFDTVFKISPLRVDDLDAWAHAQAHAAMTYMSQNPYLPQKLEMRGDHSDDVKLIENDRMHVWYQTDHTFNVPKISMGFELQVPEDSSVERYVLSTLYKLALGHSDSKWIAPAQRAGLSAQFGCTNQGYALAFSGYPEKFMDFVQIYVRGLKNLAITADEFEIIKKSFLDDIGNRSSQFDAYKLVSNRMLDLITAYTYPDEMVMDMVKKVSFDDVKKFAQQFLNSVYVKGYAYGSVMPTDITRTVDIIFQEFKAQILPKNCRSEVRDLLFPINKPLFHQLSLKGKDNVWMLKQQVGKNTPKHQAAFAIANTILQPQFFNDLRTQQTLGYIVSMSPSSGSVVGALSFLIQSKRSLHEVSEVALKWIANAATLIKSLSPEEFEKIKNSKLETLKMPFASYEEKAMWILAMAMTKHENLAWKEELIAAYEAITQDEVVKAFETAFDPKNNRSLTIWGVAEEGGESLIEQPQENQIMDTLEGITAFKQNATFVSARALNP